MSVIPIVSAGSLPESFFAPRTFSAGTAETVAGILEQVHRDGDAALHRFAEQFDRINPEYFEIPAETAFITASPTGSSGLIFLSPENISGWCVTIMSAPHATASSTSCGVQSSPSSTDVTGASGEPIHSPLLSHFSWIERGAKLSITSATSFTLNFSIAISLNYPDCA